MRLILQHLLPFLLYIHIYLKFFINILKTEILLFLDLLLIGHLYLLLFYVFLKHLLELHLKELKLTQIL